MKLQLDKLTLKNFLSFEQAELDLVKNGYILVNGVNENPDDSARSNGSGKSSIWEAIAWCLTGETIRGTKEVKRIGTDEVCEVSLTFKVDNDEYKIVRSKDPSNLKIFINGEDKSGKGIRDSEKLLEEYIPDLTPQLLGSVVILGQGLPQRFTNNTPSGRKEVLEKLSKSDFMIEDLKKRIAQRKDYLQQYIRTCEDTILAETTKQQMVTTQLETTQKALDELPTSEIYEKQIEMSQKEADENKVKLDAAIEEKDSIVAQLNDIQDKLNVLLKDYQEKYAVLSKEYYAELAVVNSNAATLKANIKNLSAEITKLKDVKEFCPTCGQRLPDVHIVDTSKQEAELAELNDQLADVNKKELEGKAKFDAENNKLDESFKEATSELESTKRELDDKLAHAKSNYINLNSIYLAAVDDLNKAKFGLENFEKLKTGYNQAIQNFNTELVDLSEKINYNKIDRDTMDERLAVVNKMSTIVTRDFRGYLLSNVIDFINNKSKEYSKQVFDTDKLEFAISGNNISISYDCKEYENLSGGEKQKVDLIVQLAIRDMLCTFLGFSCNILVVDELFDNLDDIGCQKVIDLISNKIADVDTVYIVTHHRDISIPTDSELVVTKGKDKISRIGG